MRKKAVPKRFGNGIQVILKNGGSTSFPISSGTPQLKLLGQLSGFRR